MAKRQYRTAAGKSIDMEALRLKHETTPAVGNMRVNARGDELTPDGKVIKQRNEAVQDNYYNLHAPLPTDGIIPDSSPITPVTPVTPVELAEELPEKSDEPVKSIRAQKRSISGVKRI